MSKSKKPSIREIREAKKSEQSAAYREKAIAAKNKKEEEQMNMQKHEETKKTAVLTGNFAASKSDEPPKVKSLPKANGLKSMLVYKNDIYMTSNGKGNAALVEKLITNDVISTQNTQNPKYNAKNNDKCIKKVDVKSGRTKFPGTADKPKFGPARQDIIKSKALYEKKYFGEEFTDNIHIQIAYQIIDLYKILAVHSNNIVFGLNNLLRPENPEFTDDFIGYLSTRNSYSEFINYDSQNFDERTTKNLAKLNKSFTELIQSPLKGYFGDALTGDDKTVYAILAMLGNVRQNCVHGEVDLGGRKTDSWIFNLDDSENLPEEFARALDNNYNNRMKNVKDDFLKTAGVNFKIVMNALSSIWGKTDEKKVVCDYFEFTVLKNHKNMGFSIKKLRETMLEIPGASVLKTERYDSVRAKLYKAIDFLICYYYRYINPDKAIDIIDELRASTTDKEKEKIYTAEAQSIWNVIGQYVVKKLAYDIIDIPKNDKDKTIKNNFKEKYATSEFEFTTKATKFSKLVFLLTKFLDGKEINDLTTTLINKFESIQSLIDVSEEIGNHIEFVPEYSLFSDSGKIAGEIRLINSVARMSKPLDSAKKAMYREAVEILNVNMSEQEIEETLDELLCLETKEASVRISDAKDPDKIAKAYGVFIPHNSREAKKAYDKLLKNFNNAKVIEESGGYITKRLTVKVSDKTGVRNFIANNVIESDRFQYLIKYNNAKKTRELAKNRPVVWFALSRVDEKQINRYYSSCDGKGNPDLSEKIDYLADLITKIDFSDFNSIVNRANVSSNTAEGQLKQRAQAVVGLYLTIMYHITKNLVNVNSRYVIAFAALERDFARIRGKNDKIKDWLSLTNKFIENHELNKHAENYLKININNICEVQDDECDGNRVLGGYRNNVAHLTVIRNADLHIDKIKECHSYFELYHFIMQSIIKAGFEVSNLKPNSKVKSYFDALDKYGTYCKDFVKALNTPFGYCLARYKNLSIEPLFDKDNTRLNNDTKDEVYLKIDKE